MRNLIKTIERIEDAERTYLESRLYTLKEFDGNSLQIEIEKFGENTAYKVPNWANYWYGNLVLGIDETSVDKLSEIENFFASDNIEFRIRSNPRTLTPKVGKQLVQRGYYPFLTGAIVYSFSPDVNRGLNNLEIREVNKSELSEFLDIYRSAFEYDQYTEYEKQAHIFWLKKLLDQESIHLMYAEIMNEIAGVGVMYITDNVAIMADAATLPRFRKKGVHQALIYHRIIKAKELNCDLFYSDVQFLSSSHRNMQNYNFEVAYLYHQWIKK